MATPTWTNASTNQPLCASCKKRPTVFDTCDSCYVKANSGRKD